MTFYEKLNKLLEHGFHVVVKKPFRKNSHNYMICWPHKNEEGDCWMRTSCSTNLESLQAALPTVEMLLRDNSRQESWQIVDHFFPEFKHYEDGERVVHKIFGVGTISKVMGSSYEYEMVVDDKLGRKLDFPFRTSVYHLDLKPVFECEGDLEIPKVMVVDCTIKAVDGF